MRSIIRGFGERTSLITILVVAGTLIAFETLDLHKHGSPLEVALLAFEVLCLAALVTAKRYVIAGSCLILMMATFFRL